MSGSEEVKKSLRRQISISLSLLLELLLLVLSLFRDDSFVTIGMDSFCDDGNSGVVVVVVVVVGTDSNSEGFVPFVSRLGTICVDGDNELGKLELAEALWLALLVPAPRVNFRQAVQCKLETYRQSYEAFQYCPRFRKIRRVDCDPLIVEVVESVGPSDLPEACRAFVVGSAVVNDPSFGSPGSEIGFFLALPRLRFTGNICRYGCGKVWLEWEARHILDRTRRHAMGYKISSAVSQVCGSLGCIHRKISLVVLRQLKVIVTVSATIYIEAESAKIKSACDAGYR